MTEFTIRADDLRTHSSTVSGIASSIGQAASAAQTTLDPQAFGLLCSFIVPIISGSMTSTTTAIQDLAKAVDSASTKVRTMANTYDDSEATAVARYRAGERQVRTAI